MDVRVGGEWRFVSQKDGNEFAFHGVYKEIKEPEFITWTFNFEPMPGHELIETITFEEIEGGKTKIKTMSQFNTLSDLEGMVSFGMEAGAAETWDRLNELVKKMQAET